METKKQILVVEDKEQHLADARAYFSGLEGVVVTYATNLQEAETAMQSQRFDGVISDIFFPIGYEGAQKQQRADTLMAIVGESYDCMLNSTEQGSLRRRLNIIKTELESYRSTNKLSDLLGLMSSVGETMSREEGQQYRSLFDSDEEKGTKQYTDKATEIVAKLEGMISSYEAWKTGDQTPPFGVLVATQAVNAQISVVYCTDLYHHSTLVEPINGLVRGVRMIDAYKDRDTAADSKNWEKAYQTLVGEGQ